MTVNFQPTRQLSMVYCCPPTGNFAIEELPGRIKLWDHCREQFAVKFDDKVSGFYFSHPDGREQNVAEFIRKFEKIVKSSFRGHNFKYTQFARTSSKTILYLQPSTFWRDCYFKRSLLTILVRCGLNYEIVADNFDDSLFSPHFKENAYLIDTKPAVLRFMFGFTHYTGIAPAIYQTTVLKHGWREEFCKLDDRTIRQRLVLPPGIKKKGNLVGTETLWI